MARSSSGRDSGGDRKWPPAAARITLGAQGSAPSPVQITFHPKAAADLIVPATGYLTVVDLGTATAVDGKDGTITPITDWTFPVVRPGRYVVNWSATDQAGNVAAATQNVDVLPLVEFRALPAVAAEGGIAVVFARMNGNAPEYPVVIDNDYSIWRASKTNTGRRSTSLMREDACVSITSARANTTSRN